MGRLRYLHLVGVMTAIPKPDAPRFSDDELVEILNTTRQRSIIIRDTGPDHDSVDVPITHMPGCAYRFVRDQTGWTYFMLRSPGEVKLKIAGTLDECLGLFASDWS
jgi:hypothetical protein